MDTIILQQWYTDRNVMSFIEVQQQFTRHMRDPEHCPAPADVEDRRMGIYRDLLYRNVEGFMAGSFPVLRRVIPDPQWHALIRDYFRDHQARTPLFPKMPLEFVHYLEQERGTRDEDPPFLSELARYEWAELELSYDTRAIDMSGIERDGDLLGGMPVLNPLVLPLACAWPVHRIRPGYLPRTPPEAPTYLLLYRDRADAVGFLELNPVSARLVQLLQENTGRGGRELLEQIAGELRHPQAATVIEGGLATLRTMLERDIILGTRQGIQ